MPLSGSRAGPAYDRRWVETCRAGFTRIDGSEQGWTRWK
jgi:hypothetical protein